MSKDPMVPGCMASLVEKAGVNYVVTNTDGPRPGQDQDGGEASALAPVMVSQEADAHWKMWLELDAQGKES